jgi:hypothetical protein
MKFKVPFATMIWFAVLLLVQAAGGQQAARPSASLQEKIAALRELRDSGVLTEQEYQAKVHALQGDRSAPAPTAHVGRVAWSGTNTVEAVDPHFQMTAFTLQVPAGWRYAGEIGVSGLGTCHRGDEPSLRLTMESPDGLYRVMQLPGVKWSAANDRRAEYDMEQKGCPPIEIFSAADFFVHILLPELHPNARIIEVLGPGPGLEKAMQDTYQKAYQRRQAIAQALGQPMPQYNFDGATVRLQFDQNGTPMEEMLSGFVQCEDLRMPRGFDLYSCSVSNMSLIQAPLGQLDTFMAMPEFAAMMQSRQVNRDWADQQTREVQMRDQDMVRKINGDNQRFQAMMAQNQANYQIQYQNNQALYDIQNRNAQQFNHQLQVQGQNSIARARDSQNRLDEDAHRHALYYGDRQENINPFNGQTVVTSNKSANQWISNDGRTTVGTPNGVNPNDYVGPGGPTFAPMTPK